MGEFLVNAPDLQTFLRASKDRAAKKKFELAKIPSIVIAIAFRESFASEFCLRLNIVVTSVVLVTKTESTNSWTRIVGLSGFATDFWRTLYGAI